MMATDLVQKEFVKISRSASHNVTGYILSHTLQTNPKHHEEEPEKNSRN